MKQTMKNRRGGASNAMDTAGSASAYRFHDSVDGQAEEISVLIGKLVRGIWLLPDGIFVSFQTDEILEVKPIAVVGFEYGLHIRSGTSKTAGFDWATVLDAKCEHIRDFVGLAFNGLDKDVMKFGKEYGIQITLEGARFVRAVQERVM